MMIFVIIMTIIIKIMMIIIKIMKMHKLQTRKMMMMFYKL